MARLILFVEGDDDQRFMERVVKPLLTKTHELIKIQKVASFAPKDVCRLVRTFRTSGWQYLLICDKDDHPCKTRKKEAIIRKYQEVEVDRVIVVDQEIESWYVAGVDALVAIEIGFTMPRATESFSKQHMLRSISKRYPTVTDVKLKLLDNYSVQTARQKSASFAYLLARLEL